MKIAHREISPTQPPLVVAEIGINHGGSLDVAKGMVLAAHRAQLEQQMADLQATLDEHAAILDTVTVGTAAWCASNTTPRWPRS